MAAGAENVSVSLNHLVFLTHQGYMRKVRAVHQIKVEASFLEVLKMLHNFSEECDINVGERVIYVWPYECGLGSKFSHIT